MQHPKPPKKPELVGSWVKTYVLCHAFVARVPEGVEIERVGEILPTQLHQDFCPVVLLFHLKNEREHPVGIRERLCSTELVTIHLAGWALNVDVPKHHGHVVAVGGLA